MLERSLETDLDVECGVLCRQIFGLEPTEAQRAQYRLANAQAFGPEDAADLAWVREAAARGRDLEAMELVLRVHRPDNVLSKKFHMVFFLIEATPAGFPLFVRTQDARLEAWVRLGRALARTFYKYMKGQALLLASAPAGRRSA